jgi:hypothetical protein
MTEALSHSRARPSRIGLATALVAVVALTLLASAPPLHGVDWGWQLAIGRHVLAHGKPPATDVLCWTTHGNPDLHGAMYAGHGLLLALVDRAAGAKGLAALRMALAAAAFGLLGCFLWRRGNSGWQTFVIAGSVAVAAEPRLVLRPHLHSYILTIATVWLLLSAREQERPRRLWWLVPVYALWANLHSGVVLAVGMLGVWTAVELIQSIGLPRWRKVALSANARRYACMLAVTAALAAAATCLTPAGVARYTYIFGHSDMHAELEVLELAGLDFGRPGHRQVAVVALLLLLLAFARGRPRDAGVPLATAAAFYTALTVHSFRFFPFMLLLIALAVGRTPMARPETASEAGGDAETDEEDGQATDTEDESAGRRLIPTLAGAVLALLILPFAAVQLTRSRPLLSPSILAPAAVDFLLAEDLPDPLYNTQNFGGVISWRSEGKRLTFRDARQMLFSAYIGKTFAQLDTELSFNTVIAASFEPLGIDNGFDDSVWALVYFSDHARIYVRETPDTVELVERLGYSHLRFRRVRRDGQPTELDIVVDPTAPTAALAELDARGPHNGYYAALGRAKAYLAVGNRKAAAAAAQAALYARSTITAAAVYEAATAGVSDADP